MSRIERKYICLISTSYLAGLFDIFLLQDCVYSVDFLPMRTLCDAYPILSQKSPHGEWTIKFALYCIVLYCI